MDKKTSLCAAVVAASLVGMVLLLFPMAHLVAGFDGSHAWKMGVIRLLTGEVLIGMVLLQSSRALGERLKGRS